MPDNRQEIEDLRQELEEIRKSLPAHSMPVSIMLRLEEIEEKLRELQEKDQRNSSQ